MSFWKTQVLEITYEWLVHTLEPQVERPLEIISKLGHFAGGEIKV